MLPMLDGRNDSNSTCQGNGNCPRRAYMVLHGARHDGLEIIHSRKLGTTTLVSSCYGSMFRSAAYDKRAYLQILYTAIICAYTL